MRHLLTDLRGNPIYWRSSRSSIRRSTLLFLVKNRSWNDVIRRARAHPEEVMMQEESSGNTPLHMACQLDPPADVIRRLQAAANIKNAQGATPLHVAASHRCSATALQMLIDVASATSESPPTAELSRMGRSPIHYACMSFRGLELQAFSVLLEATLQQGMISIDTEASKIFWDDYVDDEDYLAAQEDATRKMINVTALKDHTGNTPLGLLFRRYRERVRAVIQVIDKIRTENKKPERAALAAAMAVQAELGQLWGKSRLVVARLTEERLQREGAILGDPTSPGEAAISKEAAAWAVELHSTPGDLEHKFRIVHASVALIGYGCPPEMIRLAISMQPEQLKEMDENGDLPIHIAAKASSFVSAVSHGSFKNSTDDEASAISDSVASFFSSATTNATPYPFDKVIKILLSHYPDAAKTPQGKSGRLPLVLAAQAGQRTWEDGIETLLYAYPPALHSLKLPKPVMVEVLALITGENSPSSKSNTFVGGILQNLSILKGSHHKRPESASAGSQVRSGGGRREKNKKATKHNKILRLRSSTTIFQLLKANPDIHGYGGDLKVPSPLSTPARNPKKAHHFARMKAAYLKRCSHG